MVSDMLMIIAKLENWGDIFRDPIKWRSITDSVLDNIPLNYKPNTPETIKLLDLYSRLYTRNLYKQIKEDTNIDISNIDPNQLQDSNIAKVVNVIGFSSRHGENPMTKIRFYDDDTYKTFYVTDARDISAVLSNISSETQVLTFEK